MWWQVLTTVTKKKKKFGSGRGHSVWACVLDVDVILEIGQRQPFQRGDFWGNNNESLQIAMNIRGKSISAEKIKYKYWIRDMIYMFEEQQNGQCEWVKLEGKVVPEKDIISEKQLVRDYAVKSLQRLTFINILHLTACQWMILIGWWHNRIYLLNRVIDYERQNGSWAER